MSINSFSPYIRRAMPSVIEPYTKIGQRIIFDYELLYIEEGCIELTEGGVKYSCPEGTCVFLRPGKPHILEFVGDKAVSQPHIHFDAVFDEYSGKIYISYMDFEQIPKEDRAFIRKDIMPDFESPILKISDKARFRRLFFSVIECYSRRGDWYELRYKGLMLELLHMILADNARSVQKNDKESDDDLEIVSIKDYIDANFKNAITLESLEKQFHYDRFYISRRFKSRYNMSIMKYYDSLRIEAAKEWLEQGKSVSEVAELLNVTSIYSFSRFFKNKTGYPPSDCKNSVKRHL